MLCVRACVCGTTTLFPEIDANLLRFYRGTVQGVGLVWNLHNTENEANVLLPLCIKKLKGFRLQGGFAPDPLSRALPLDPAWGFSPRLQL